MLSIFGLFNIVIVLTETLYNIIADHSVYTFFLNSFALAYSVKGANHHHLVIKLHQVFELIQGKELTRAIDMAEGVTIIGLS